MNDHVDEVLLETIVKEMVDWPEDVRVERASDEMGVLLSLHVNPADMGKIIGVQGATAKALRLILRNVGLQNSSRINIKIIEPAGGKRSPVAVSDKTPLDDLDKHLDL